MLAYGRSPIVAKLVARKMGVKMYVTKFASIPVLSILALTGCGGGSDGVAGLSSLSAIDVGTVPLALEQGATLSADHVAQVNRNFNENTTALAAGEFSVRKTADGNLAMIVNGDELIFTDADQNFPNGYEVNDSGNGLFYNLYAYDGPITDVLDTGVRSFANVFTLYKDINGDGIGEQLLAVVGTKTELAQLNLLTGASYDGWMNANFWNGSSSSWDDQVRVRGGMNLSADFTNSTISGQSKPGELLLRSGGNPETSMAGTFFYDGGVIDGTSFDGSVSVDSDFLTSTNVGAVAGEYEGSFYGPFADEAAGIMTGTTDGGYNMIGQFNARTYIDQR